MAGEWELFQVMITTGFSFATHLHPYVCMGRWYLGKKISVVIHLKRLSGHFKHH